MVKLNLSALNDTSDKSSNNPVKPKIEVHKNTSTESQKKPVIKLSNIVANSTWTTKVIKTAKKQPEDKKDLKTEQNIEKKPNITVSIQPKINITPKTNTSDEVKEIKKDSKNTDNNNIKIEKEKTDVNLKEKNIEKTEEIKTDKISEEKIDNKSWEIFPNYSPNYKISKRQKIKKSEKKQSNKKNKINPKFLYIIGTCFLSIVIISFSFILKKSNQTTASLQNSRARIQTDTDIAFSWSGNNISNEDVLLNNEEEKIANLELNSDDINSTLTWTSQDITNTWLKINQNKKTSNLSPLWNTKKYFIKKHTQK